MTSQEQYQLFQVLYDQLDSQSYPEVYPEQVFDFLNLEVDRWCQAARKAFETSSELRDYLVPLVADVYTANLAGPGREAIYSLADLRSAQTGSVLPYRHLVAAKFADCFIGEKKGICYLKEQTHNTRSLNQRNPFTTAQPYLCYYKLSDNRIVVDTDPAFHLGRGRFTIIRQPAPISRTQHCDLPESLHRLLVEMAVESVKQKLQPVQS